MKKVRKGITLFHIEDNGILRGTYTNEIALGEIFEEIAVKHTNEEGLIGTYDSVYFESNSKKFNAILNITVKKNNQKVYSLSWKKGNNVIFKGVGYLMNNRQFIVRYEAN